MRSRTAREGCARRRDRAAAGAQAQEARTSDCRQTCLSTVQGERSQPAARQERSQSSHHHTASTCIIARGLKRVSKSSARLRRKSISKASLNISYCRSRASKMPSLNIASESMRTSCTSPSYATVGQWIDVFDSDVDSSCRRCQPS